MNKKVNMDFFKNIISPIKLPKIRTRKIFNTQTPNETPQVPTVVDRLPAKISTISSLVEATPSSEKKIEEEINQKPPVEELVSNSRTETESPKVDYPRKRLKFTGKLSKQYKELSEFKFKHILGKKTIVRTTSIDVENYEHKIEEIQDCTSEFSDYEFEFYSLPAGATGSFEVDLQTEQIENNASNEIKNSPQGSTIENDVNYEDNLEISDVVTPNDSSLFRQVHYLSNQKTNETSNTDVPSISKTTIPGSKLSFNKQSLEDMCNKAKTKVATSLRKFKLKYAGSSESRAPDEAPKIETGGQSVNLSTSDEEENELSLKEIPSNDFPQERDEIKTYRSTNVGKPKFSQSVKRRNAQEDCKRITKIANHAPPIPKKKECHEPVSASFSKVNFGRRTITSPCERQIAIQDRCHNRKPSLDSCDSDSWIPETFTPSNYATNLNIIEENPEAWSFHMPNKTSKLKENDSVDIFTAEGEKAFEDFDDALLNVPTIHISGIRTLSQEVKFKPLVKQSSILWHSSEDMSSEDFNVNVNQLISCFEKPSNSDEKDKKQTSVNEVSTYLATNYESPQTIKKFEESAVPMESKPKITRTNLSVLQPAQPKANIITARKCVPSMAVGENTNGLTTLSAKSLKCSMNLPEEINEDIFHSLDTEEYVSSDIKRQYRHANVRLVYTINV